MFHPEGPTLLELARQALSSTERGYDLLAPKFDLTPFRTPDEILEPLGRFLAESPPDRALDLCCGTGAVLSVLAPIAHEMAVGVDFSRGMLRVARSRLATKRTHLVQAEALALPFKPGFDLVTCFSALGHFLPTEHVALVKAVRACLVPGGRFVFATGTMPPLSSPAYWVSRAFNAAMHARNAVWSPPFVMYYLTFLLPEARAVLERDGFDVEVRTGIFGAPFQSAVLVEARRK
jgi:ubiquinone/menaquinone biosynthesis C-methylase UbiE